LLPLCERDKDSYSEEAVAVDSGVNDDFVVDGGVEEGPALADNWWEGVDELDEEVTDTRKEGSTLSDRNG
jgi:hypothetical protein